jgi:hypothetical protein
VGNFKPNKCVTLRSDSKGGSAVVPPSYGGCDVAFSPAEREWDPQREEWREKQKLAALKVPRQCPIVLRVKVTLNKRR